MTVAPPRIALRDVQLPVAAELEQVVDELRRIIWDAGFIPAQRDTLYRSYVLK